MAKFIAVGCAQWVDLDKVDSFWFNDMDDNYHADDTHHSYGIEFKINGYDEYSSWFKTREEREEFLKKLEDYYGGWL